MATSKTLTPTNVTIQIPAMTDAPDQSVNSNCIDKLGDAVNTLNSKLGTIGTEPGSGATYNLDDIRGNGFYNVSGSSTNVPVSGVGGTLIHTENNFGSQRGQLMFTNNRNGVYVRSYGSNTWGPWASIT